MKHRHRETAQIIDIAGFRKTRSVRKEKILRISPEFDGLSMLYGNDANPGKLFTMKVLAWALKSSGDVVGLVPWLNRIVYCPVLKDPLNGHWEGYYNPRTGKVFYEAPRHKKLELGEAVRFYENSTSSKLKVVQEIPDTIGTHAVLTEPDSKKFIIQEVFSWRLLESGEMRGMLVKPEKVELTPVLIGDNSLSVVQDDPRFRYFFQYRIANKIKRREPDAMNAMALLMDL